MREIRNKRLERRDLKTTEFAMNGHTVPVTTGVTETVQEERCPNCGLWFETRGVLGALFMSLGATCDERHGSKAPVRKESP